MLKTATVKVAATVLTQQLVPHAADCRAYKQGWKSPWCLPKYENRRVDRLGRPHKTASTGWLVYRCNIQGCPGKMAVLGDFSDLLPWGEKDA